MGGIMIEEENSFVHWNYYCALDQDLLNIARYIEFTKANNPVFSIELAKLLIASSSEIDVVMKLLCKNIDPNFTKRNPDIIDYKGVIRTFLPDLITETAYINRYSLIFTPWINWEGPENPDFWKGYNKVKHHRDTNYPEANLKNVLHSMAALLITNFYYYKTLFVKAEPEKKFGSDDIILRLGDEKTLITLKDKYYPSRLLINKGPL
jgi:hypothetical protein